MISLISLFNITLNQAQENEIYSKSQWVAETDSSSNRLVSEIMQKSDLTERTDIIRNLGKRKDRNFKIILEDLYYKNIYPAAEKEILLYLCVNSFINSEADYSDSCEVYDEIFADISRFSDSLLRKELIREKHFRRQKNGSQDTC